MSKPMVGIIWLIINVHIQKVLNRSQIGNALSLHIFILLKSGLLFAQKGQNCTSFKRYMKERNFCLFRLSK